MSNKLVTKIVRLSGVLAAGVALLAVNACSATDRVPASSSATPLPQAARLISITPSLTETICDLGLTSQLVARTANDDYPPEILGLPQIGDIQPNYEAMVALHPDAVLLDTMATSESLRQRLDSLGFRVISTRIDTLNDLSQQLPYLGQQLGCQSEALALQQRVKQALAALQQGAASLPRHPRVFLDVYHQPLMTAGGTGLMHELLLLAGGINVFDNIDKAYPQIDSEDLLLSQPDIVVLTSLSLEQARKHPQLGQLAAVREGRALAINPSLLQRPTLRSLQGVQMMQDYFRSWAQSPTAKVF